MTSPRVPRMDPTAVTPTQGINAPRAQGLGAEAFGAGLGAGMQKAGGEMMAYATEEHQKAIRTMAIEARTKLDQKEVDLLYHPENGVIGKRGKEAFTITEPTLKAFDESALEIENGIASPDAKNTFKLFAQQRRVEIDKQLERHVSGELKSYAETANRASLESTLNNIVMHFQDPDRIEQERKYGLGVIMTDTENKGMPPQAVKAKVDTWESMVHKAVIEKMSVDNPLKAKTYFEANKDKMLGMDAIKIEHSMKQLVTKQVGMNTALALGATFAGVKDPNELDGLVESALYKAQADLKDNPDALNIAEAQISQMAAMREKGIRIARQEASRPISKAMANARREGRIPSLSDFDNKDWTNLVDTDPDKADDILRSIQSESRTALDRKQAKIDRAEAKQDRDEYRKERETAKAERLALKKKQDGNYSGLWGNPAALVDADLEGMVAMGALSPEDGKKLETRQKSYDPDHILAEAKGVDKVIKAANIKPESDEEKAVKKFVADRIFLSKEKPSPEHVTQFAREALMEVDIPWGFDKSAYKMTLADVPKVEADKIRKALSGRGRSSSDAAIIQVYVKKQSKGAK
jgi:hypothetical protein